MWMAGLTTEMELIAQLCNDMTDDQSDVAIVVQPSTLGTQMLCETNRGLGHSIWDPAKRH